MKRNSLAATETQLLDQLIGRRGLATILGWRSLHIRPAMVKDDTAETGYSYRTPIQGGGIDFPDLLLVKDCRPGRLIAAELKRKGQWPRSGQCEWLDLFASVEGVETYLWYTEGDLEEIQEILTLGHVPNLIERIALDTAWVNRRDR